MGGGWPTFRFLKGGIPRAYPAWDLWILRVLTRSCISVGTGEDEKEARRCMSPRLPTFAKNKGAKVGQPAILDFIQGLRGTLHLTFEEGTHSAWLYDLLARRVARVVVCNPRQNALLKAGNKSDTSDARKLGVAARGTACAGVSRGRQHAHLAGTGPQLRRADRRHDAGDGPGESVVSQPSDRVRGEETVRSPASPGVVVEAERGGFASPGGAALRRAGCLAGAAPRRQARAGAGEPQACGGEAAAHRPSAGCQSRGGFDRAGTDAAPLPQQTSVLGLLRAGLGDAQQRRLPLRGRTTGARQETGVHPRTQPQPQSRSEEPV